MRTKLTIAAITGAALLIVALSSIASSRKIDPQALQERRAERGKYLVNAMGCADCHAPKVMGDHGPVPDESRFLSGHPEGSELPPAPVLPPGPWVAVNTWDLTAWSGPWGTSFAINLTPDENTGIGSWSEDTFVKALKTGRHMGVSRPILPPMPWEAFRNLTDEDLRSIYAYLRTLPPIHNRIPQPLPPPGDQVAAVH